MLHQYLRFQILIYVKDFIQNNEFYISNRLNQDRVLCVKNNFSNLKLTNMKKYIYIGGKEKERKKEMRAK